MNLNIEENINKLQYLLEKQIEAVRKGDFVNFDELAIKADAAVAELAKIDASGKKQFAGQLKSLTDLYKKLELVLSAAKDSVGKQINQIGKSKKTMQVYKNNE